MQIFVLYGIVLMFMFIPFIIYFFMHRFIIRQLFKLNNISLTLNQTPVFWITLALFILLIFLSRTKFPVQFIQFILSPIEFFRNLLQNFITISDRISEYFSFTYLYFWVQLIVSTIQIARQGFSSRTKVFLYNLIAQLIALICAFFVTVGLLRLMA